MKKILILFLLSFVLWAPIVPADEGDDSGEATVEDTVIDVKYTSDFGKGDLNFKKELSFVTTFLESNYILALGLIFAVMGFWQFFVNGNGFGMIMIVLAVGLTAFPGIYKGFYNGTRPFVNTAAGATTTQSWE